MAVGGLGAMNYEPVPEQPGAFRFYQPGSEQPTLLFGQPAQELAGRIDATKAEIERTRGIGPQPVAGPGTGESKLAALRAANQAQATRDLGFDPSAPFADIGAPAPPRPAAAPAPPPAAAQQPGPAAPPVSGLGMDPNTGRLVRREYVPGTRGVSQEQLKAQAAQGVAMPAGSTRVTEGGFEPSQKYLAGLEQTAEERIRIAQDEQIKALELNDRQQQIDRERVAQAARFAQEEQNRQQELATRVQRDEEFMVKTRKDYQSAKVDPERLFRGEGGTLRAIGMALAAGLGAFGATLGRTENFAMRQIDAMINNDIRAQEAEIQVLGQSADNALAQFNKTTGDLGQSKALLRTLMLDQVAAQASGLQNTKGFESRMAELDSFKVQVFDELNKSQEAHRQASLGKNTVQVSSQMAYPKAGSAGGYRDVPLTFEQELKLREETRREREEGRRDIESGLAVVKAERELAEGPKKSDAEKRATADRAFVKQRIEQYVRDHGGQIDPTTGKITGADWDWNFPGVDSDETKKKKLQLEEIANTYARTVSPRASPSEREAFVPEFGSVFSSPQDKLELMYQGLVTREAMGGAPAEDDGEPPPVGEKL